MSSRLRRGLDLLAPCLLAVALRLYGIRSQVLVDDEWHLVHKLRDGAGLASLIGDFGADDHSIGLSLVVWSIGRATALDELLFRLPSLVAGLLLVAVVPAALARRLGRSTAIVLAWLLAVAPFLCFTSRLARPYAVTTLLAPVAALAFARWFERGERRAAATYVATAALAPLFHLPALPAVLAPCALPIAARDLRRRPEAPTLRDVVRLVLVTVCIVGLVLALPALESGRTVLARLSSDRPGLATLPLLLELLTGTRHPLVIAVVTAAGVVGMVAIGRRDPLFLRLVAVTIAVQALAIYASGPAQSHVPIVTARYLAVVLPFLWTLPAAGLVAAAARLGIDRPQLLGGAAALVLLVQGPLRWTYGAPNDFTNHVSYQADYTPGRYFERFRPHAISEFYRELAARPPASVTIVEAPWYFYFHPFAYTQRVHRQHVLIGFVDDRPAAVRSGEVARDDPTIRLRNAVHLDDRAALKERHVDFVILHRNLLEEIEWPHGVTERPIDVSAQEERCRAWFGAPVFADDALLVFAVR